MTPKYLSCPHCEAPLFPSQPCDTEEHAADECWCGGDGHIWFEGEPTTCPECGYVSRVEVDSDGRAYSADVGES